MISIIQNLLLKIIKELECIKAKNNNKCKYRFKAIRKTWKKTNWQKEIKKYCKRKKITQKNRKIIIKKLINIISLNIITSKQIN